MRFRAAALVIVAVLIAMTLSTCKANVHSWGVRTEFYNHRMYERTLIDETNTVPKDYTIIYKYYGAHFKPVAYIEIDVNTPSSGYIHMNRAIQESYYGHTDDRQIFDARIDIKGALNVSAKLKILGMGMLSMPSMGLKKLTSTKSIAYVHVKNSNLITHPEQFYQNSIGKRRTGDKLLRFESKNVTNHSRFPSRAFEYSGGEYITYVGFSFNSPTAMVLVNTSFVDEREFNAVAYDMNREHFVANISVYGIKATFRPDKFLGVI